MSLDSIDDAIRTARRHPIAAEVILRDPDGHGEVALPCRDISATGIFVYSSACVGLGSEFVCRVPLDGDQHIEALGRVSRVVLDEEEPGRSGMGIHFDQAIPTLNERLAPQTFGALAS